MSPSPFTPPSGSISQLPRWLRRGAAAFLLVALLTTIVATTPGSVAQAQAPSLSQGCTAVNHPDNDGFGSYFSLPGLPFAAGEQIRVTAGPPTGGPVTTVELGVNIHPVDSAPFPGTVTYTFPIDFVTAIVAWIASADVTWIVSCGPADVIAPELTISIDPTTKDARVEAVDNPGGSGLATTDPIAPTVCTTTRPGQQTCIYRASDLLGNSVTATLQITKQSGQTQVIVQRLQYSGKPATTPLSNSLVATFAPASGPPTQFTQTVQVTESGPPSTSRKLTATWTAAAGRTTITQVTPLPSSTTTCLGPNPTLLVLHTQAGALRATGGCLA